MPLRIAIFDPSQHATGFTILYPEADYYSIEPSSSFNFQQRNIHAFRSVYGFNFLTDLAKINDTTYDIFICIYPIIDGTKESHIMYGSNRVKIIAEDIFKSNVFKRGIIVDNHDSGYDPTLYINNGQTKCIYLKRNFRSSLAYKENVHPFPFLIFGLPTCYLWFMLKRASLYKLTTKIDNRIFWAGNLYKESHPFNYEVDRITIYNDSKQVLHTCGGLQFEEFMNCMASHKMSVDLNGCGHPNKRTFEILVARSLIFHQKNDLVYPFENGKPFPDETCFETGKELCEKYNALLPNKELYDILLEKQNTVFDTYFTKDWIRNYIDSLIDIKN